MNSLNSSVVGNGTLSLIQYNGADIAFLFGCTTLVMIMTPGLGFFYAGFVGGKNVASTIFQSIVCLCIVGCQWWIWGFSLAFSPTGSPVFGDLSYFMLIGFNGADLTQTVHPNAPGIPLYLYFLYELMFAGITPALITGGMAERLNVKTFTLFVFIWTTIVYCPIAHSIWCPGGWLFELGVLDFAGGLVVHLSSGTAALVFSLYMTNRTGTVTVLSVCRSKIEKLFGMTILGKTVSALKVKMLKWPPEIPPSHVGNEDDNIWHLPNKVGTVSNMPGKLNMKSTQQAEKSSLEKGNSSDETSDWKYIKAPEGIRNLPLIILGTTLLWFGWFGANGGSSVVSNNQATIAMMNTAICSCFAGVTWMLYDIIVHGKPRVTGLCIGIVAGLVIITPCAGYVYPGYAVIGGVLVSLICPIEMYLKGYVIDDTLDTFAIHGFVGCCGILFTGIFASKNIVYSGTGSVIGGGWVDGNWIQMAYQLAGLGFTFGWSFLGTSIIFWVLYPLGWNVNKYEERIGLDLSQHGEPSFIFEPPESKELLPGEKDTQPIVLRTWSYLPKAFHHYVVDPVVAYFHPPPTKTISSESG